MAVGAYAFTVTYGIWEVLDKVVGLRADEEHEHTGLPTYGARRPLTITGSWATAPRSHHPLPTAQKAKAQA